PARLYSSYALCRRRRRRHLDLPELRSWENCRDCHQRSTFSSVHSCCTSNQSRHDPDCSPHAAGHPPEGGFAAHLHDGSSSSEEAPDREPLVSTAHTQTRRLFSND